MRRVSRDARLLFVQLWLLADDASRLRADQESCWRISIPADTDAAMLLTMWLDELEREKCIERYEVDDKAYLRVVKWRKHQKIDRPSASCLPGAPREAREDREVREESRRSQQRRASSDDPRESPEKSDVPVVITEQTVLQRLEHVYAAATLKDSFPSALRSAELMGKKIGLWEPKKEKAKATDARGEQPASSPTSCPDADRSCAHGRVETSPVAFVREVFGVVPDPWQDEVLQAFPGKPRLAMKACKGPGKTAVLAWLAWNFLVTRIEPKIAATSITSDNLFDNLWAEMAKWQQRAPYLREHFKWTKDRIVCKGRPETWWMSARTWNRSSDRTQQGNTLAGLHADHILFILDESGGIPDAVMATAEAALASCVDGHIVQAGNPTHLEGPLYRACTSERRLWHVTEITADPDDPRRSTRVKAEWAKEQIEKYGRDNPWVLVNVFGKFPPGSLDTLIGPDECAEAIKRHYRPEDLGGSAKVLGVDVARFGDDASVIFPRQGLVAFAPQKFRNLDGTQGAGAVARKLQEWQADAVFIDDTGGWGASWIDNLRLLGHAPIGVGFATRPSDPRYDNKRSEMYFQAVDWIRKGGALPQCPELVAALGQTTYSFRGDRLLLEPKEQVKQQLGCSPDEADAFALPSPSRSRPARSITTARWRASPSCSATARAAARACASPSTIRWRNSTDEERGYAGKA